MYKNILDQYYTNKNIAKTCLSKLDLSIYDCIIEPSAGDGSFSDLIPNCKAYDIDPHNSNIIQADWFKLDKSIFSKYKNILVVGNPPFGNQCKLAIDFFNEFSKFANTIAFILPKSFHKDTIKNKLNLYFKLDFEMDLSECEFYICGKEKTNINCVFQIWNKTNIKREKIKYKKLDSSIIEFVNKSNADFTIRRVGALAGKANLNLNLAESSNYFIKNISELSTESLVSLINFISFTEANYATGPKSLSKQELIQKLNEIF